MTVLLFWAFVKFDREMSGVYIIIGILWMLMKMKV